MRSRLAVVLLCACSGSTQRGVVPDAAAGPRIDAGSVAADAATASDIDAPPADASPPADATAPVDAAPPPDADPCPGETLCEASCVDTQTSDTNCGACGHSCAGGVCSAGLCAATHVVDSSDPSHLYVDATGLYYLAGIGRTILAYRTSLDGASQTKLFEVANDNYRWLTDLAVAGGYVYLSSISDYRYGDHSGWILRMHLDGTSPQTIYTDPYAVITSVAATADRVYFINEDGGGVLDSIRPDGTDLANNVVPADTQAIVAGAGFAVFAGGEVHWSDGRGTTNVLGTTGNAYSAGLASDGTWVAWSDPLGGTVQAATTDGAHAVVVATGQPRPEGVTIDGGHVYWANAGSADPSVWRANLDGTNAFRLAAPEPTCYPSGVVVYGGDVYIVCTSSIWRAPK